MSDAVYALVFALAAAAVSVPPILALLLYHGIESALLASILVTVAGLSAGAFAFFLPCEARRVGARGLS